MSKIDMATRHELVSATLTAIHAGRIVVHPTDTIPGLTFDPNSEGAWQALCALKSRMPSKAILLLAAHIDAAKALWSPLPPGWDDVLAHVWPGPLSIVWQASASAPQHLLAEDGTIGVRVPRLRPQDTWFGEVIAKAGGYLPTTSINRAGESPACTRADVATFVASEPEIFSVPVSESEDASGEPPKPSTVIRLTPDSGFELLRLGSEAMLVTLKERAPARSRS